MGTRADFYIENANKLTWIASIAWDGYPDGIHIKHRNEEESVDKHVEVIYTDYLTDCSTEDEYQTFLKDFLSTRDDVTYPDMGWPWPWENSRSTDYAYVFSNERKEVLIACFGRGWFNQKEWDTLGDNIPEDKWNNFPRVDFPDMSKVQNVAWDKRSGIMIFDVKEKN